MKRIQLLLLHSKKSSVAAATFWQGFFSLISQWVSKGVKNLTKIKYHFKVIAARLKIVLVVWSMINDISEYSLGIVLLVYRLPKCS